MTDAVESDANNPLINDDSLTVKGWWDDCHRRSDPIYLSGSDPRGIWDTLDVTKLIKPGVTVLNIGVGLGNCTLALVEQQCDVHALDISEAALERARQMTASAKRASGPSGQSRIKTWLAPRDFKDLPPLTYDVAISHLVAQHMANAELKEQLAAVIRSLKPEGVFALQFTYAMDWRPDPENESLVYCKAGGVRRSLSEMMGLVKSQGGAVVWAKEGPKYPEWRAGWYCVKIMKEQFKVTDQKTFDAGLKDLSRTLLWEAAELSRVGLAQQSFDAYSLALKADPQSPGALAFQSQDPEAIARALAHEFGVNQGKAVFFVRALMEKVLLSVRRFRSSNNKRAYLYHLTPKGMVERAGAAGRFAHRKLEEYRNLSSEVDRQKREAAAQKRRK